MATTSNFPMEMWLEILATIERTELAERLSLTNRLAHAAAHILLHDEGEHVLGNLCFQKRPKSKVKDIHCAELYKIEDNGHAKKVPIADYKVPENVVNFRKIELRLEICDNFRITNKIILEFQKIFWTKKCFLERKT